MRKDFWKVTADLICAFIFAIPLWVYNLLDVVPVSRLGFFCSDNSIRYPYHSSTVSSVVLMVVGFGIMILMSSIVETWLYKTHRCSHQSTAFHPLAMAIYRAIGYFIIGAAMNQFLTDVAKLSVGRLRPHFYDLCQPSVNCSDVDPHTYIEDYQCLRTSHPLISASKLESRLKDARKSFPSGHASFSMFSSLFIAIYLEYRLRSQDTRIVRHLVQLGIVAYGVWVSCTRIYDYKHRLSDVATGMVLGIIVASFASYLYIRSNQSVARRVKCSNLTPSDPVVEANTNNTLEASNMQKNTNTSMTRLNEVTNDGV